MLNLSRPLVYVVGSWVSPDFDPCDVAKDKKCGYTNEKSFGTIKRDEDQ
jgi:hypothetical protein